MAEKRKRMVEKRKREVLRAFFKKGNIPTQSNFEDLIESSLNLLDDGVAKPANGPLSINTVNPADEGVLDFKQSGDAAGWQFRLKHGGKTGLSIHDVKHVGGAPARLFIEASSGNVEIAQLSGILKVGKGEIDPRNPSVKLEVKGGKTVLEQEMWKRLELKRGWKKYDNEQFAPPESFKDSQGIVHLQGLLEQAPSEITLDESERAPICRLPDTHCPEHRKMCDGRIKVTSDKDSRRVRIDVLQDGNVFVYFGVFRSAEEEKMEVLPTQYCSWLSLDGISFRAK